MQVLLRVYQEVGRESTSTRDSQTLTVTLKLIRRITKNQRDKKKTVPQERTSDMEV